MIPLKQLCRELNLEPRAARIKLRALIEDHGHKQRWAWAEKEAIKIKKLLMEENNG